MMSAFFSKAAGAVAEMDHSERQSTLNVQEYFESLQKAKVIDKHMSIARASEIFMLANFEEDSAEEWTDWEWEMDEPEFREAMVRLCAGRESGWETTTQLAAKLDHFFHEIFGNLLDARYIPKMAMPPKAEESPRPAFRAAGRPPVTRTAGRPGR